MSHVHITAPQARTVHAGSTTVTLAAQAAAELGDLSRLEPGRFHHFRTTGDAEHKHGWAVRHGNRVTLGSFKAAARERVVVEVQPPSPDQLRLQRRGLRAQRQATEARHEQAATRAAAIWGSLPDSADNHPYLVRKRVSAHGVKRRISFAGDELVVPLFSDLQYSTLRGLQFIRDKKNAEGKDKEFLPGTLKTGSLFVIGLGPVDDEPVLVAEGFATAASLYEALHFTVVCAFDCGNLKPVCLQVRSELPRSPIIVAADNDTQTDGNPGVTHARQAAAAVGGRVVLPAAPFNDFNDQWVNTGRISL